MVKAVKIGALFLFSIFSSIVYAQNNDIYGKWLQKDEEGTSKYYFFNYKGHLYGLVYYYKDAESEVNLIDELNKHSGIQAKQVEDLSPSDIHTHLKDYIWVWQYSKTGNKWKGSIRLKEDDEFTSYDSELKLLNENQLEISYSYWGLTDSGVWIRINQ